MHRYLAMGAAILLAAGTGGLRAQEDAGEAEAQPDEFDLTSILEEGDETLQQEMQEGPPGDMQPFTILTDDDISGLETDDVYKNNTSFFRVTKIYEKGKEGGKFEVKRTSGEAEPGRTWHRVSGLGPLTIVSRETLLSRFMSGGPIMYPIALLLLGVVVITLNSLWIYRRSKQCPGRFVEAVQTAAEKRSIDTIEGLSAKEKGLLPSVCRAMVVDFDQSTEEDIRMRCESEARRQVGFLRIPLRTLNFIAAVAPLLGLLGTVMGMIACFDSIAGDAASAGKSQAMAGGIKVALLTTAFGLTVAVPALLVYFIFNQRLTGIVADCESYVTEFIHKLSRIKRGQEAA